MEPYLLDPLAQSEKGNFKNIWNVQHKSYCTNDDFDCWFHKPSRRPKYQWANILNMPIQAYKPYHG